MEEIQNIKDSPEESKWCVYIHRNKLNNKVYIGQTVHSDSPNKRWKNGSGDTEDHQIVFYRAIQKYGWDNFEHIIFAENLSMAEAYHVEMLLIALYKSNCNRYNNPSYGYNMTDGGDGKGKIVSEETRKKQSIAQKKRCANPEEKERRSRQMKEMMSNPEIKEKISQSLKGKLAGEKNYWYGKPRYGENNPNYGNKWSKESRERFSEYSRNRPQEHRNNLSKAMKERYQNPIENPRYGTGRPVVQLTINGEYINQFNSATIAYRETGINKSHIGECCRGEVFTAGGFIWMYADEYDSNNVSIAKPKDKGIPVIQLTNEMFKVNEYSSALRAQQLTKIDASSIRKCCNGKQKMAGGYNWMFKSDYDQLVNNSNNDLTNKSSSDIITKQND